MEPFEHVDAPSVAVARDLLRTSDLGDVWAARPIAGGTDLLTTLKLGIHQPARLVNLKTIPGLDTIMDYAGTLRLGALVPLDTIARHELVAARYLALAESARGAASPQLRNLGTLGGNLAQETRCWYYRNPDLRCWLRGGETCYARQGDNSHHAIFTDGSPCVSVYPSDPATALLALDAAILVQTDAGERQVPIADFFTLPSDAHRQLNGLAATDLITGIVLPPVAAGRTASTYLKAMERAAWSFALVGVAVSVTWRSRRDAARTEGKVAEEAARTEGKVAEEAARTEGKVAEEAAPIEGKVAEEAAPAERLVERVRIALGGVAPVPRRAPVAEDYLAGKPINAASADEAGRLAVQDAAPLAHNTYKVRLVRGLVARALLQLGGS